MKKLILSIATTLAFAQLPSSFGMCNSIADISASNPPIPLKTDYKEIKEYACNNKIVFIGIREDVPGLLKLWDVNKDTKDFLIKHFTFKGHKAVVYIDKGVKKGDIIIQLGENKSVEVMFNGTDYKQILEYLESFPFYSV
jgi:hypothetical protein